jgi:hypothetical protein
MGVMNRLAVLRVLDRKAFRKTIRRLARRGLVVEGTRAPDRGKGRR